nr:zinc finger and btb domain containing protein [Hymenolepis microstoma]
MSSEDGDLIYPLVINQLLHDGYGVFAISLKKLVNSNSDAVASDKLLKIVKLGLAVSKFLEESNLSRDFSHIAHALQPNHHNGSSFLNSSSSSHNQSIDQSPQQILNQNGSQNGQFSLGLDPPIKLEPGDSSFNFPFSAYHRQWSQITNSRSSINLDGEIHELPGDGSPIKLFECSLCGKIFNRRDKVKRHLSELHHGIKRHQCATCFRLFSRNDKLVRHIMTVHQGIRDFSCLHCPRKFSRRWDYQRHMQTTHPTLLNQSPTNQRQQSTHSTQQDDDHSPGASTSANNVISITSSVSSTSADVSSPPPVATVSTSTPSSSGTPITSVATPTSAVDRNMLPVFPNLTGQNVSPWPSNITSSSTSAFTTTTSTTKSKLATNAPTSSASSSTEPSTSSAALPAFSSSNAHAIFPIFPVFSQPSASSSGPNASTPFSNNAVFPSSIAAFTPVSASYHNGYTPMASPPVSNSSNQSNCNESTSLTRMLL